MHDALRSRHHAHIIANVSYERVIFLFGIFDPIRGTLVSFDFESHLFCTSLSHILLVLVFVACIPEERWEATFTLILM